MSNRYELLFVELKKHNRKAFIPYTMLGYPNESLSLQSIETMIESGAAALEFGLAFSDPLADGPVIQQASAETIASGFRTADAFQLIAKIRKRNTIIPITLMCYYNSAMALGLPSFCQRAREAGVDGLLIVDLPPEQSSEIQKHCRNCNLQQIFIISPLTTNERMQSIAQQAGGFLYAVSRLGTTGVEERYDEHLSDLIKLAAQLTKLPVAVGFGVSTPEQAQKMYYLGADAVITGSRIIELISRISAGKLNQQDLSSYIKSMVCADKTTNASVPH